MTVLIEAHYFPCIAYFTVVLQGSAVRIEKHEHFVKQSLRNRCYINTEHGVDSLHVPLIHHHGKGKISEIRIDNTQKWVNNHWRTIVSAYGKSPFFEFYADDVEAVLFKRNEFLYDLNLEILTLCLKWLRAGIPVMETLTYESEPEWQEENVVRDLRGIIDARKPQWISSLYKPVEYKQVFGNAFVANASLIDLIFCCGPEAGRIVRASRGGE